MAEELYFIKTNPNIAKINLYNKLCREEENLLTFLPPDAKTSLEIIKNKVKDSVEELTKDELLSIFSWFCTMYPPDHEEIKTQLFVNGIDLFYEIPSSANTTGFLQILSDYEKYSRHRLDYMINPQHFNQFLVYGIFFTEMMNKDRNSEHFLSDYLKPENQSLYLLAEDRFNSENFNWENNPELRHYFTDLYDLTKFYKGTIIKLDQ